MNELSAEHINNLELFEHDWNAQNVLDYLRKWTRLRTVSIEEIQEEMRLAAEAGEIRVWATYQQRQKTATIAHRLDKSKIIGYDPQFCSWEIKMKWPRQYLYIIFHNLKQLLQLGT
jgi:hypothetical protein